ncbi:MAG: hypothetical protein OEZ40_01060 [Candidatus Bathyarchaeota archaeon]|nr:hypothetical protein [Candidatus Bathyarchaeota archaeon]
MAVFFLFFAFVSLLIPSPMFPGNVFCPLIGGAMGGYSDFFCAILNGVFYGVILWLVFVTIGKKLEEEK